MSAQEREALVDVLCDGLGWDWPENPAEHIPSARECVSDLADALLAAGWTRPVPDGDAIERAQNVVMSAIRCYMPFGWEEGEPDGFAASIVAALGTSALLASPVREPGRESVEVIARVLCVQANGDPDDALEAPYTPAWKDYEDKARELAAQIGGEPGRSEAEIKAEALEDARKIVADELAAEEARLLAFENPLTPMLTNYLGGIRVALDALDPYRADQVTDTEGTKP